MYTTETIEGKLYITGEYTVSEHLSSAIINDDYSTFDYMEEDREPFDNWLEAISEEMKQTAKKYGSTLEYCIHDIKEQDSYFDRCEYYRLMSDCVTLTVVAVCNVTEPEYLKNITELAEAMLALGNN